MFFEGCNKIKTGEGGSLYQYMACVAQLMMEVTAEAETSADASYGQVLCCAKCKGWCSHGLIISSELRKQCGWLLELASMRRVRTRRQTWPKFPNW